MDKTKEYYVNHYKEFIDSTYQCDMSLMYQFFESHLNKPNAIILDLGFGSGRDFEYFVSKGYEVYGLDPVEKFCDLLKEKGFTNIFCQEANEMTFKDKFDGIWACASLLHINRENLSNAFKKCALALKKDGIMYCSFKYGNFEGIRNGRYNIDLDENSIKKYVEGTDLIIEEIKLSLDVRTNRENEKWLNVILRKN